jgi:hypothetical protein
MLGAHSTQNAPMHVLKVVRPAQLRSIGPNFREIQGGAYMKNACRKSDDRLGETCCLRKFHEDILTQGATLLRALRIHE